MTTKNRDNVGWFIRSRREEKGLSQTELAKELGMKREYLAQIEAGKPKWPQKYIAKIAEVLDIPEQRLAVAAGKIDSNPTQQWIVDRAREIGRVELESLAHNGDEDLFQMFESFARADDDAKTQRYIGMLALAVGLLLMSSDPSRVETRLIEEATARGNQPIIQRVKASV